MFLFLRSGNRARLAIASSFLCGVLCAAAPQSKGPTNADKLVSRLNNLAARFVAMSLNYDPTIAYSTGLTTTDHHRFPDRTPQAVAAFAGEEEVNLRELNEIDSTQLPPSARPTYAILKERLESDLGLRVCKQELWNVNHFDGWQSSLAQTAAAQPVGTKTFRTEALKRWGALPHYLDVEIANLRTGLSQGYSAPKTVVRRVIAQMQSLSSEPVAQSPFYSPALRDNDPAFRRQFTRLVKDKINPAIKRYRDFLFDEYLPKARESLTVSDLPNGPACYRAFLRSYTTLLRSPEEVFALGQQTVENNKTAVVDIGRSLFNTDDFDQIVSKSKARPENHFQSKEELLDYSRGLLAKAKNRMRQLVETVPEQDVVIEPETSFEEAGGSGSRYEPNPDPRRPGVYRIQLNDWLTKTRGDAAVTVAHETWPGHHLQNALARELQPATPLSKLTFNAAYVEGWARYAEALAEEAGIYDNQDALILRRVWPSRGMVVDPGIHALGWSRQQAIDYLVSSGRFTAETADAMVDRIAIVPGQLSAYDSGNLEIKALREKGENALGLRFDIRLFNQTILEEGVVPLSRLHTHIEEWLSASARPSKQ
jgi:uncharacterized protein (DUF885 family)